MESSKTNDKCELCHKNFSRKSALNRHVREQHLQPGLYHCKQCGLRFSKKYNLQVHVECVHSKNRKQIKCSYCNLVFTKLSAINNHVKVHHINCKTTAPFNANSEFADEEADAKAFAESVLKKLKEWQKDIQSPENLLQTTPVGKLADINKDEIKFTTIRDNLYPSGHFTLIKTQTIKRVDGKTYLICEFCRKEFKKTYNYLRHRRIHTKLRPFVCILCKKSFPTTAQLKAHCTIHKLDEKFGFFHKLYKCPKCNESFNSMVQFDKHLSSISTYCNVTFKCPHCLKSFKTLKPLLRHKHSLRDNEIEILKTILPMPLEVKLSKDKDLFRCSFCGIEVHKKILLKQHEKRHENLFKNRCAKCSRTFATQIALKFHAKVHILTRNFKCHYCYKCFCTRQSCRRHMLTHLNQLLKTHETFKDQNNTLALYPTFIEGENNCAINTATPIIKSNQKCNTKRKKNFNTSKNIQFKCEKCEKTFPYKAWMQKHFKYKHTADFSYECSNCFRKFRTKQCLESHLLIHSTERLKITCQVCGRQYASEKSLKLHLRIHTQEKPFSCDKCCKLFRTSGHLIQHRKSNHKE